MPRGISLTIGLNAVDPQHYGGWTGTLAGCEYDANDMALIATSRGFSNSTLLTTAATRNAVLGALRAAASELQSGDILMLSYSGHGGQTPDLNNDEIDKRDETWCLYDGQLIDDELYRAFSMFAAGVRILVFSDSCHSGTVIRQPVYAALARALPAPVVPRVMPEEVAERVYELNRAFYSPILQQRSIERTLDAVKASVLLISGCQDNQTSSDGEHNGLFTGVLKQIWNGGKFRGSYWSFYRQIKLHMPPFQSPNYMRVGAASRAFEHQRPFSV